MNTPKIDSQFSSLIPPLSQEEFAQLETNIVADGCRDPLVTWQGILLDGHNRFEICQRRKLEFQIIAVDLPDRASALDWIDANQLGRRNLAKDLMSIIRGRLYNRTKKAAHGREGRTFSELQSDTPKDTATAIAEKHNVSRATIIRDGKRAEAFDKLAAVAPDEARAVMAGTKRFNEVRREIKRAEVKEAKALPTAKYRVVYADPPWSYNDKCDSGSVQSGGAEQHYPSMTISELCALPIRELAENDAVLFLWVTSPLLFECLPIIGAWGFAYKTSFVWDKIKHNMGHYNSVRHELLLLCTRGSCLPDVSQLFDSVQSIKRTGHSEKPEAFRHIIQTLYPHGKRVELFARQQSEGWDTWGNQCSA